MRMPSTGHKMLYAPPTGIGREQLGVRFVLDLVTATFFQIGFNYNRSG